MALSMQGRFGEQSHVRPTSLLDRYLNRFECEQGDYFFSDARYLWPALCVSHYFLSETQRCVGNKDGDFRGTLRMASDISS